MNNIFFVIIFVSIMSFSYGQQSIEQMIESVLLGKTKRVDHNQIKLVIDNDSININSIFLQALIEEDGEKATSLFTKYYKENRDNKYNEIAIKKIADYNYSKGLYINASEWYKKIPEEFPKSVYLESSLTYYLNSLLVSGNYKEVDEIVNKYKKKYPKIKFNIQSENTNKNDTNESIKNTNSTYSVLVGNYDDYKSALNYKKILSNEGFLCRIEDVKLNGSDYYSLRIGYYKNKKTAENILKRLKSRVGISDAIIISN